MPKCFKAGTNKVCSQPTVNVRDNAMCCVAEIFPNAARVGGAVLCALDADRQALPHDAGAQTPTPPGE